MIADTREEAKRETSAYGETDREEIGRKGNIRNFPEKEEDPEEESRRETKGKIRERKRETKGKEPAKRMHPFAQFLLYLLLLISIVVTILSGAATNYLLEKNIFAGNREVFLELQESIVTENIAKELLYIYANSGRQAVKDYCYGTNIQYSIYYVHGNCITGNMSAEEEESAKLYHFNYLTGDAYSFSGIENYKIKIRLNMDNALANSYTSSLQVLRWTVIYRYEVLICLLAGSVVSITLFLLLIRNSVKEFRRSEPLICKIHLEILTAAVVLVVSFAYTFLSKFWHQNHSVDKGIVLIVGVVAIAAVVVAYLIHLVGRFCVEGWYRNTLCYVVYCGIRKLFGFWKEVFVNFPLIWKAILFYVAVSAVEFSVIWMLLPGWANKNFFLLLWAAEKIVLLTLFLYVVLTLKKFEEATAQLAAGNLNFKIKSTEIPGFFRKFGGNINAVTDSVSLAVEERLKSERMKTELITNVSHDIKTPLTSIINFSDLIVKEPTDNPKVTEYADHLYKQSTRLKKLIEDLMEASKASTGNLEVSPEPCDVKVILGQCIGEYEKRLQELDLELIVKNSPEPIRILADPKMLWRIFENLISNICKYSQSNTRVYLSTECREDTVWITFKNISKYALDISPEDLMERFVRGDLSRHTEGNGLGLSVVKSLMDLQGGKIYLAVDGDLFKATLEFPIMKEYQE